MAMLVAAAGILAMAANYGTGGAAGGLRFGRTAPIVEAMSSTMMIHCPQCGTENRVPFAKLEQGLRAKCGRCKQPLPSGSAAAPLVVTDATFAAEIERSPLPVLIDAWAAWCGPCRTIAPAIDELAAELQGRMRVAKLNVDENPATASRFDIRSIPTLLVFAGGREVDRIVGAQPKHAIRARLDQILASLRR
jgi:thioredoxin 2